MSTELSTIKTKTSLLQLTQFWGGNERGISIQLTQDTGYIQLTVDEAAKVAAALDSWSALRHQKGKMEKL